MQTILSLLQSALALILLVATGGPLPDDVRMTAIQTANTAIQIAQHEIDATEEREEHDEPDDDEDEPEEDNDDSRDDDSSNNDEEESQDIIRTINIAVGPAGGRGDGSDDLDPRNLKVGQEIWIFVEIFDEEEAVKCAPFTISVDGEQLKPDTSLCTNSTISARNSKGRALWFDDVSYTPETPGEKTIEVESGDASESIEIVVSEAQ